MSLISDSGAVVDINEIAAEITAEECERIENATFEELKEDLCNLQEVLLDYPEDQVTEVGISPALESLMGLVSDIQTGGAISRADASVLKSMAISMEGFEDTFATMPLGSFTEMPSKVNFEPSMENLVVRIIQTIVRKIKEIIDWLMSHAKNFVNAIRNREATDKKINSAARKAIGAFDSKKVNPAFLEKGVLVDDVLYRVGTDDYARKMFLYMNAIDKELVTADLSAGSTYQGLVKTIADLASALSVPVAVSGLGQALECMEAVKTKETASSNPYPPSAHELKGDDLAMFLSRLAKALGEYKEGAVKLTMVVGNADKVIKECQAKVKELLANNASPDEVAAVQRHLEDVRQFEKIAAAVVWMRSSVWNAIGRGALLLDKSMQA